MDRGLASCVRHEVRVGLLQRINAKCLGASAERRISRDHARTPSLPPQQTQQVSHRGHVCLSAITPVSSTVHHHTCAAVSSFCRASAAATHVDTHALTSLTLSSFEKGGVDWVSRLFLFAGMSQHQHDPVTRSADDLLGLQQGGGWHGKGGWMDGKGGSLRARN